MAKVLVESGKWSVFDFNRFGNKKEKKNSLYIFKTKFIIFPVFIFQIKNIALTLWSPPWMDIYVHWPVVFFSKFLVYFSNVSIMYS